MSMLKKIFIGSVMMMTVLSMSVVVAPKANAAAASGDLIKISGVASVYYLGANGKRYVFPNSSTYFSWYKDFSGVVTIPASEMEGYPLAANVLIRPGTKLVKSPSIATVYAVEPNGALRSIVSEANAIALWGADWAKMVVDMPDSFFVNYTVGAPLTVGQYPAGQLIKTAGSPDVMLLAADGTVRKFASESAFTSNHYSFDFVATAPSTFVLPTSGAAVNGVETGLANVSQNGVVAGPVVGGSGLSVALASDTAAAGSIAMNSSVDMLKFNLTAANDGAVNVNSITLTAGGLGSVSQITNVVLYANGTRIGNVKNVVDSNRQAIFNLSTPLNIPAGQTVAVTVKATITGTNQYNLGIAKASDIGAAGSVVSGSFPLSGNTMSGVNVTVGKLTLSSDGNPADVNLGDVSAVIGKFKLANDNVEDITLNSVTVQRSNGTSVNADFESVSLYYNGAKIASAAGFTGKSNGYATFALTSPLLVKKNQTVRFEVRADVVDGRAGDTTTVAIDSASDIAAVGSIYGQQVNVVAGSSSYFAASYSTTFAIKAGTIAIARAEAPNDKVKSNQTGVVFGTMKITSNSSKVVTFDTLKVTIDSTVDTVASAAYAQLENVKLVDTETGTGFDLSYSSSVSGTSKVYGGTNNVGMTLTSGKTYTLNLVGDISSTATSSSYAFKVLDAAGGDLVIHDQNNSAITDITPNAISYNAVTVQKPTITFTTDPLSATYSAVVGTTDVQTLSFNMKANQTSDLTVTELDFHGSTTATTLNSSVVSQYRLYKDGVATPIKSVSGSSVSSGIITFNGLTLNVPANQTVKYYVTADLVNDNALNGKKLNMGLEGYTVTDSDNNNVYDSAKDFDKNGIFDNGSVATAVSIDSARDVSMVGAGSLWISMDNTNTNTQKSQIVVAGNVTPYIAAVKMRSTNEDVKITDLSVNVGYANASDMFSTLSLYDANGNILSSTNTVTASTTFTGVNLTIPQTTATYYIKGALRNIGDKQVGVSQATAAMSIYGVTAKGASSNTSLTAATTTAATCSSGTICYVVAAGNDKNTTIASNYVEAVASKISSVDLVTSGAGCSLATSLTAGNNTVAIIKVTTDNSGANTLISGDVVKTVLSTIRVDYSKTNVPDPSFTIQKCSGLDSTPVAGSNTANGTASSSAFTVSSMLNDNQIASQSTSYYKVVANITSVSSVSGNSSLKVDLNNLDGGSFANFAWKDSSDASSNITSLLLSNSSIEGVKLTN